MLESELWTAHGVRVEFMTLAQIAANSRLGLTNSLFIRPTCTPGVGDEGSEGKDASVVESDKSDNCDGDDEIEREEEREGEVLVSVAYYRAGYTPDDYPTDIEWSARETIENSLATKCPTIGYQLAGTKKIQQVLCEENVLEKFLPRKESELLRKCFAGEESVLVCVSTVCCKDEILQ
jgi:Eukaryotic glutathione synthase